MQRMVVILERILKYVMLEKGRAGGCCCKDKGFFEKNRYILGCSIKMSCFK